jgi:methyl-accepting chemotaxis protein
MEQLIDPYCIDETDLKLRRQYIPAPSAGDPTDVLAQRRDSHAERLARVSNGIARGAQRQAELLQKTSRLISDMADLVDQIGQVAHTVAGTSAKATAAARAGRGAVGQSSQGMERIRARTIETAARVKQIGQCSDQISQIVEMADNSAIMSILPALNAAIQRGHSFTIAAEQACKLSKDAWVRADCGAIGATATETITGTRLACDASRPLDEILRAADAAANLAEQIGRSVEEVKRKSEDVVVAIGAASTIVLEAAAISLCL